MSKLAQKSLLFLLFHFLYSVNILTLAQPNFYDYLCDNNSNYTTNTSFETNLDRTLTDLPNTNTGYGFFNSSSGQDPDKVHSIGLCRGDIELSSCHGCVSNAVVKLRQVCPKQKDATGYYENCTMRYSKDEILWRNGVEDFRAGGSSENVTNAQGFDQDVVKLMNNLTMKAAGEGTLRKYATGIMTRADSSQIYGLVQCTPNLSERQCSNCLTDAVGRVAGCCSEKIGARVLSPFCNLRYENYQFYNAMSIPPQQSSSPQPSSPPPPPPLSGGGNTNMAFFGLSAVMAVLPAIFII